MAGAALAGRDCGRSSGGGARRASREKTRLLRSNSNELRKRRPAVPKVKHTPPERVLRIREQRARRVWRSTALAREHGFGTERRGRHLRGPIFP